MEDFLILLSGKYVKNPEKRKKIAEELKMSAIHIRPLEEELRDAIIDGEIMRAEERGEEKIINKLLKKYDAKEISEMIEIDIEKIEKIKSTKY